MTLKNARTILFSSLAVLLIVSFGGAGVAFGEVSEEIKAKALEGKQIWEKIEDIKNKEVKTEKDELDEKKFQEQFDAIAKEMNRHGIATPEQWEKNPDYWRDMNLPPIPDTSAANTPIDADGINPASSGSSIELMGPCYCPQGLNMIAGFDYQIWGWWWSSGFSPDGWLKGTFQGDVDTSDVTTLGIHSQVTPHLTVNIEKAGSAVFSYAYTTTNNIGSTIGQNTEHEKTTTKVKDDYDRIPQTTLSNVPAGSTITFTTTVYSLSP